jgi:hypothetical protein
LIYYFKYGWYLLKHKTFVMIECFKRGLIWRGIKHDLSKINPKEFFPYTKMFFSKNKPTNRDKTGYYSPNNTKDISFLKAWNRHWRKNDHHWQHFCNIRDKDEICTCNTKTTESMEVCQKCNKYLSNILTIEMPINSIKEMICDWEGARRAQKGKVNIKEWFNINNKKMYLHNNTRKNIENILNKWYS